MLRESKVADSDLNFVLADWLIDDVDEGGFEKSLGHLPPPLLLLVIA
jgi:hypothetical protein